MTTTAPEEIYGLASVNVTELVRAKVERLRIARAELSALEEELSAVRQATRLRYFGGERGREDRAVAR